MISKMNYRVSFPVIGLLDIHILQMRGVMGGGIFLLLLSWGLVRSIEPRRCHRTHN